MRWSVTIARVGGTKIRIHLTFVLLLLWIGMGYYAQGGMPAAARGILFILTLFLCVILHELGHAFAARRYGIQTPDITLLPIGGVARMARMPDKPSQEIVVALAGPAVNLVIATVLFFVLGFVANPENIVRLADPDVGFLPQIMAANVVLFLFNLVPAFPMDGGRVLRAALATRMPYARATSVAASIGQGLAFVFGFLGLLYNPFLIFVALFVYLAAAQEAASARMRDSFTGLRVRDGMVVEFHTLHETASIADAVDLLLRTTQHDFPVIDNAGSLRGIAQHDALIEALRKGDQNRSVGDVMTRGLPLLRDTDAFERGLATMREAGANALPVVDMNGGLVGILSLAHVAEVLAVESAAHARTTYMRR
jgi:Zn-dependent protease/CBS domain-containing protein